MHFNVMETACSEVIKNKVYTFLGLGIRPSIYAENTELRNTISNIQVLNEVSSYLNS